MDGGKCFRRPSGKRHTALFTKHTSLSWTLLYLSSGYEDETFVPMPEQLLTLQECPAMTPRFHKHNIDTMILEKACNSATMQQ